MSKKSISQIETRENLLDWAVTRAPSGVNLDDWLAAQHIMSLADAIKWEEETDMSAHAETQEAVEELQDETEGF